MDGTRTVRYNAQMEREARARQMGDAMFQLTVFDADRAPFVVRLSGQNEFIFGRREGIPNDGEISIPLESPYVSRHSHGRFLRRNGRWYVEDMHSRNGIFVGDVAVGMKELSDGDIIRIDKISSADRKGVLMLFGLVSERGGWRCRSTSSAPLSIGRDPACQIVLPHSTVSRIHATIANEADGWTIQDNNSTPTAC